LPAAGLSAAAVAAGLRAGRTGSWGWAVGAGVLFGALFFHRPYDAVLAGVPLGAWLLWRARPERPWRGLPGPVLAAVPGVAPRGGRGRAGRCPARRLAAVAGPPRAPVAGAAGAGAGRRARGGRLACLQPGGHGPRLRAGLLGGRPRRRLRLRPPVELDARRPR